MTAEEPVRHIRPKKRTPPTQKTVTTPANATPSSSSSKMMEGILRKPKYTTISTASPSKPKAVTIAADNETVLEARDHSLPVEAPRRPQRVVQDFVVERPRRKKDTSVKSSSSAKKTTEKTTVGAIEGYTPVTTTLQVRAAAVEEKRAALQGKQKDSHEEDNDDKKKAAAAEDDLVFSSLADLMEAAGTLPKSTDNDDDKSTPPTMVEAELNFSCVAPEEYQELRTEEQQAQYAVAMGRPLQGDEDDTDSEADAAGGGLWGLLGDDDDDSDEEEATAPVVVPRAFLHLWTALAQWVSPTAVAWIRNLPTRDPNRWVETFDRSDVGASRCAGLMALLKMHTSRAWQEVTADTGGTGMEDLGGVERRLGDLLRSFDYSLPTPRFDTSQARALACVLLDICRMNSDPAAVPACCHALGMTLEEYRYLTRSALVNFEPVATEAS